MSVTSPPGQPPGPFRRLKGVESLSALEIPNSVTSIDPLPDPKPFTAKFTEPGMAFYLIPENSAAKSIILDNSTSGRIRPNPEDPSQKVFAIGFGFPPMEPNILIRFGRLDPTRDLTIDGGVIPVEDECYFTVNPLSGEIKLHDLSDHQFTELWQGGKCRPDWVDVGTFRTCNVPFDRESRLAMGPAAFRLIPRPTATKEEADAFRAERIAYAKRPTPNMPLSPMEPIRAPWQLWAVRSRAVGRFADTIFLPARLAQQRQVCVDYKRVNNLGGPSEGSVIRVLEAQSHRPLACKVVQDTKPNPQRIVSLNHKNIVPYWHAQEKRNRQEVFMPIYEGSMNTIMFWCHKVGYAVCHHLLDIMFPQMVLALDYLHSQRLVHGNIKPQNILHRGKQFCLADFGISKDPRDPASRWYRAPEVERTGVPRDKADIFSLGVILLEALETFPQQQYRSGTYPRLQLWYVDLQAMASRYGPLLRSMVAVNPHTRPSARELIGKFPNWYRLDENVPRALPDVPGCEHIPSSLVRDLQRSATLNPQVAIAATLPNTAWPHGAEICQLQPQKQHKNEFLNQYLANVMCPAQNSTMTIPHCRVHCWQAMCQIQRDGASPVWPPSPESWPNNSQDGAGQDGEVFMSEGDGIKVKIEDEGLKIKMENPDTPPASPTLSRVPPAIREEGPAPPTEPTAAPEQPASPSRILPSFGEMVNGVPAPGAPERGLPTSGAPVSATEALLQLSRSGSSPRTPAAARMSSPPAAQQQQPSPSAAARPNIPLFHPTLAARPRTMRPQDHQQHQQQSPQPHPHLLPDAPMSTSPQTAQPAAAGPPEQGEKTPVRSRKRPLSALPDLSAAAAAAAPATPRLSSTPTFPPIPRLPSTPPFPRAPRPRAVDGRRRIKFRHWPAPVGGDGCGDAGPPQPPAKLAKIRIRWADQEKPHQGRKGRGDERPVG